MGRDVERFQQENLLLHLLSIDYLGPILEAQYLLFFSAGSGLLGLWELLAGLDATFTIQMFCFASHDLYYYDTI